MRQTRRVGVRRRRMMLVAPLALASAVAAQQSQPNPCFRWSGQMALAGSNSSTLYYYGGEAMLTQGQTSGLWTNALVAIDLSKNWPTGTPPITLTQADNGNPTNPPAVALGALWASADGSKLYQYGGEFSDTPNVPPPAQQIYQYNIASGSWSTVTTTGDTVTRAAEGSTTVVPGLGQNGESVGFYFSGHEDDHTTQGWSNQIDRIYLSSLIQFDLGSHQMTNISSYSSSGAISNDSTPEVSPVYRADGTLTYVPGLGTNSEGILVAIGGATATQYVDNSVLDVYDIGAKGWTKQATLGDTIGSRINHCTVRASAKVHGTEFHQLFVYGGQQLNQSSRDSAMYILSIPSFTWTFVGNSLPGQPQGRAGHQCAISGSQMVVVGGVVAGNVICDQPGIYVYDVSQTAWQSTFTAGTQYSTPAIVANITNGIGTGNSSSGSGSSSGGSGSSDPDTSGNTNAGSSTPISGGTSTSSSHKSNTGAIAGGVVGGVVALALLLLLLLFFLRRRKRQTKGGEKNEARIESGSSGELMGFPYEKTTPGGTSSGHEGSSNLRSSNEGPYSASDDVEDETRGMEAAFGSHLVPKRTLRVTNPEVDT